MASDKVRQHMEQAFYGNLITVLVIFKDGLYLKCLAYNCCRTIIFLQNLKQTLKSRNFIPFETNSFCHTQF